MGDSDLRHCTITHAAASSVHERGVAWRIAAWLCASEQYDGRDGKRRCVNLPGLDIQRDEETLPDWYRLSALARQVRRIWIQDTVHSPFDYVHRRPMFQRRSRSTGAMYCFCVIDVTADSGEHAARSAHVERVSRQARLRGAARTQLAGRAGAHGDHADQRGTETPPA